MSITLLEIRNQVRDALSDHPLLATLTVAVNSSVEELSVSDGSMFRVSGYAEIGSEVVYVFAISEDKIGVRRGVRGTTAAGHSINVVISVDPLFTDDTINRKINEALAQLYPRIYRKISETLSVDGTRNLDLDDLDDIAPNGIAQIELAVDDWTGAGTHVWVPRRGWRQRGDIVQFDMAPAVGTSVLLTYAAQWEVLTTDSGETGTTTLPVEYLPIVIYYVCSKLGEIQMRSRMRFEGFSIDTDPSKSTAADLMGVAGYDSFKFDTMVEAKRMPMLGYSSPPWRNRKRE